MVHPGVHVQGTQLAQCMLAHRAASRGGTVQGGVMPADQVPVRGEVHIRFHPVGTHSQGMGERGTGVFGKLAAGTAMGKDSHTGDISQPLCPYDDAKVNFS